VIYLYVKLQPANGVQYFGKTKNDPFKYRGSGKVWKDIHKKYMWEDVQTIIIGQFLKDDPMLVEFALGFSAANDIVMSKQWANLRPENGLDGGNTFERKSEEEMITISKKISDGWHNKPLAEKLAVNKKKSDHHPKIGEGTSKSQTEKDTHSKFMKDYYSKNDNPFAGKKHSTKTKTAMAEAWKHKESIICPYCSLSSVSESNMKRWHFENCKYKSNGEF